VVHSHQVTSDIEVTWLLRSYCDGDVQKDESQIVFTSSQPAAQKLAIEEQGEDS
jgi:hypothetical protein